MMSHLAAAILFGSGIFVGWISGVEWHKEKNSKIMSELGAGLKQLRILAGDDADGDRARLRLACSRRLAHVQGSSDERDATLMYRAGRSALQIVTRDGQVIDVRGKWPQLVKKNALPAGLKSFEMPPDASTT